MPFEQPIPRFAQGKSDAFVDVFARSVVPPVGSEKDLLESSNLASRRKDIDRQIRIFPSDKMRSHCNEQGVRDVNAFAVHIERRQ